MSSCKKCESVNFKTPLLEIQPVQEKLELVIIEGHMTFDSFYLITVVNYSCNCESNKDAITIF